MTKRVRIATSVKLSGKHCSQVLLTLQRYDFAIAHIPISALPGNQRNLEVCDDDAVVVSAFQKKKRRRRRK